MSTRTDRAHALTEYLKGALAPLNVTVTCDARDLDKRNSANGIVFIAPGPRFEFPVPQVTRLEWTVYVLARGGTALDIWEPIDRILDCLIASGLNLESAEPGTYERPAPAVEMTGYIVTIRDDFHN